MVSMITHLTGDFYSKVSCDDLQADDRKYYDEVVYLGNAEGLAGAYGHLL